MSTRAAMRLLLPAAVAIVLLAASGSPTLSAISTSNELLRCQGTDPSRTYGGNPDTWNLTVQLSHGRILLMDVIPRWYAPQTANWHPTGRNAIMPRSVV